MTAEEAEALARECGMQYVETSAKTGLNVDAAFLVCARDVKRADAGEPLGHAVQAVLVQRDVLDVASGFPTLDECRQVNQAICLLAAL